MSSSHPFWVCQADSISFRCQSVARISFGSVGLSLFSGVERSLEPLCSRSDCMFLILASKGHVDVFFLSHFGVNRPHRPVWQLKTNFKLCCGANGIRTHVISNVHINISLRFCGTQNRFVHYTCRRWNTWNVSFKHKVYVWWWSNWWAGFGVSAYRLQNYYNSKFDQGSNFRII
jgi:hypothetical protein